jgi:hypothetical protein
MLKFLFRASPAVRGEVTAPRPRETPTHSLPRGGEDLAGEASTIVLLVDAAGEAAFRIEAPDRMDLRILRRPGFDRLGRLSRLIATAHYGEMMELGEGIAAGRPVARQDLPAALCLWAINRRDIAA